MLNYHLTNGKGEVVYSNLPRECLSCPANCRLPTEVTEECPVDSKKRRRGIDKNVKTGSVYLCSSDRDIINSRRIFKDKIRVYSDFLVEFGDIKAALAVETNKETKRLLHNLTSLNAHCIQEVYALVPQEKLTKNINEQIQIIEEYIVENSNEAARAFLRIAKNNATMRNEFSVFKKINEAKPVLQLQNHPIKKVILNALHIFFQDFSDINVYVSVEDFAQNVYIDYESVFVALYHIIENTTKYILKDTTLRVRFLAYQSEVSVQFDMVSLKIDDDEAEKIFEEGVSGKNAKKLNKAGEGIGLSLVKKLLDLNRVKIEIRRNVDRSKRKLDLGVQYENNQIDLVFRQR